MKTFDYLKQSFFFFRQNFRDIATIQLPFLILLNALALWLDMNASETEDFRQTALSISLLSLVLMPIYWAATILYMQSKLENRPLQPFQAISLSFKYWKTLLFIFILTALAISGGLLLLIIPGIYIGIRLSFADYIGVVEGKSAWASLKQSWEETDDYFWVLLQGLLILYPTLQLVEIPITQYFTNQEDRSMLLELPIVVFLDLLSALITVYGFRIYCVMREEIRPESNNDRPKAIDDQNP